jgi:hypothetical protein
LYNANATATPTDVPMMALNALAKKITAFMLFLNLRVKFPKVICFERLLNEYYFPTIVGVACAMQLVANVLATVVQLVYSYQRPVDKCFECFESCHFFGCINLLANKPKLAIVCFEIFVLPLLISD